MRNFAKLQQITIKILHYKIVNITLNHAGLPPDLAQLMRQFLMMKLLRPFQ
jgi:hypothetical protein